MDLPTTVCSQAALIKSGDMAPFHLQAVFQKAHCVTQGQLTPPPSPLDVSRDTLPSRSVTRSKLARLFSRNFPGIKRFNNPYQTKPFEGYGDFNIGHSSEPQSWEMDTQTPHTNTPPIPFKHNENTDRRGETVPFPSLDLRRISHTYGDLREVALEQEKEFRLTLPARSPLHTPLLPSPVIDDRVMYFKPEQNTPFKFENPRPAMRERGDPSYRTYDDMQIISCYEDTPNQSTEDVLYRPPECYTAPQVVVSKEKDYFSPCNTSSHLCNPPPPANGDFENSCQLESTTLSLQPLHTPKARCFQVVEHPLNVRTQKREEEGKIMLATVLVGPGKPRLVQIQRPPSSANSVRSSNPSSLSAQSLLQQSSPTRVPPSTPIRQRKEISAFSPYDTPSVTTPFTDVSRTTLPAMVTTVEQTPLSASKLDLVPKPLSFMRGVSSSDTDQTKSSPADRRLRQLERDLSSTYSRVSGESGRVGGSTVASWTNTNTHQTSVYSRETLTSVEDGGQLDTNLDAIAITIDEFPRKILGLNSPQILNLRNAPSAIKDQTHIDNLAKIFLNTPRQLLSVLAAWIIIDSYVSKLCSIDIDAAPTQSAIQRCAIKTTQPRIPKRSVSLNFSKANPKHIKPIYRLFPLPPMIIRSRTQVDLKQANEMSQESLQSIPTKARSILGLAQDMSVESSEQLLVTRAKAMSISVGVIAQKLLEVLRGEDGWDPHLWRALAVIVDLTEKGHDDGVGNGPVP